MKVTYVDICYLFFCLSAYISSIHLYIYEVALNGPAPRPCREGEEVLSTNHAVLNSFIIIFLISRLAFCSSLPFLAFFFFTPLDETPVSRAWIPTLQVATVLYGVSRPLAITVSYICSEIVNLSDTLSKK